MEKFSPGEYSIIKTRLSTIIKKSEYEDIIFDAVDRTNRLVIHTYQFLRSWILFKYENNLDIPKITKQTVNMCFKALSKPSRGQKPKDENLIIYNEFCKFYDDEYSKFNVYTDNGKTYKNELPKNVKKMDCTNLSGITNYVSVEIVTCIENNIKLNFLNYIKRFVNSSFKKRNQLILDKLTGKDKTDMKKLLTKELNKVKKDIIDNTKNSDKIYHSWIDLHRDRILPPKNSEHYQKDINNNPQKFIKYMIYMNVQLEKQGVKQFQFFPLRTSIIPKYCPIDTKALIDLFVEKGKDKYYPKISQLKYILWETYFNTNHNVFKRKKYIFDCRIVTDGYAASIQFIRKDNVEEINNNRQSRAQGSKKAREVYNNVSNSEKKKIMDTRNQENERKRKEYSKKYNEKKKAEKEEFDKLDEEEQDILTKEENLKKIEFPYMDELPERIIETLKVTNKVYVDPGKKNLLMMYDDKGNKFVYRNRKRIKETRRLEYQRLKDNYMKKNGIKEIENDLSSYNSKSCTYKTFTEYVKAKNEINKELYLKYSAVFFRQYKWYSHINKARHEDRLLNDIEKVFGKESILMYGDWSQGKQMRNFISTPQQPLVVRLGEALPMIGLKRKLRERFKIYNIDEFRTSCLNYKTETKCKNLYLPDKKGIIRKLHSVLTYKMENNRYGCVQRDINSVKNMKKIVSQWLIDKTRPEKYRRDYIINDENHHF